jgi:hypothetical protein
VQELTLFLLPLLPKNFTPKFGNHKIGQNKTHARFLTKSKEPCNIGKVPPFRVEGVHYLVVITGTMLLAHE